MQLWIEFNPNKESSIYTVNRISELLQNLIKNEAIIEYNIGLCESASLEITEMLDGHDKDSIKDE